MNCLMLYKIRRVVHELANYMQGVDTIFTALFMQLATGKPIGITRTVFSTQDVGRLLVTS